MPNCKQCGTKYSFWSARGDGLCKDCGIKADENAKREKEAERKRKEAERKQLVLEDSKRNIDLIVKALTDDPPLSFTFINWNIQEKNLWTKTPEKYLWTKLPEAFLTVAGSVIFGEPDIFVDQDRSYSGELGILVVTPSQILIGHFTSPFQWIDGSIIPYHLKLFLAQFDSGLIGRKAFNICQTQISRSDSVIYLVCGLKTVSFRKSDLYVNDAIYELPNAVDIQNQIVQLGSLVTPTEFTDMLYRGENPISESQFKVVEKDDKYIAAIFQTIMEHKNRNILVQNFPCLAPSVRATLEARIRSKGVFIQSPLFWLKFRKQYKNRGKG